MAFVLNGCGTTHYGTRWLPDGTYITTKWFVLIFVPIIPIESVRILEAGPMSGHALMNSQPLTYERVALDKIMVLKTYGWLIGAIIFVPIANWVATKIF